MESLLQLERHIDQNIGEFITILILVESLLQLRENPTFDLIWIVTILVLVETSLQYGRKQPHQKVPYSHNPCFSGNLFTIVNGIVKWKKRK